MGFDSVMEPVIYWPHSEVCFRHQKSPFDMPKISITFNYLIVS